LYHRLIVMRHCFGSVDYLSPNFLSSADWSHGFVGCNTSTKTNHDTIHEFNHRT
jgi:hypothetical protein